MTTDDSTQRTSDTPILETKDLTKKFGGLTAVDQVNYRLPEGNLQCLIGPNGAGKSTFFGLLTGRISPTEGKIFYRGEDITDLEPHERVRRGISLKFQTLNLYEGMTVAENLRIPCQRYSADIEGRVDEVSKMIELSDKLESIVGNLSHGEQQWLEIGMSIAIDPDLLLLDEPTAGMTIEETRQTGMLIESLVQEGMTVVVVEHDINLVRQISDHVTVLHNGRIFRQGQIEEITDDPEVKRIYLGEEQT